MKLTLKRLILEFKKPGGFFIDDNGKVIHTGKWHDSYLHKIDKSYNQVFRMGWVKVRTYYDKEIVVEYSKDYVSRKALSSLVDEISSSTGKPTIVISVNSGDQYDILDTKVYDFDVFFKTKLARY